MEGGGGEPGRARAAGLGVLGAVCRALCSNPEKSPAPQICPRAGETPPAPLGFWGGDGGCWGCERS